MKLKAQKMGSMKALKESLKKGGSGGSATYIKNVPADGITVRFLTEPEEWFGYSEYWDGEAKTFVPMVEGEILPDGAKPSFRYLANAVDMETDRVIPLKLSKTAANSLILKYDKYDTITDRAYELQKHGEGLDTTYDVTPDAPAKMNLAKYDLLDLEQILIEARVQATGEQFANSGSSATATEARPEAKRQPKPASRELFPNGEYRMDYTDQELSDISHEHPDDWDQLLEYWEIDAERLSDVQQIDAICRAQDANASLPDEDEEADEEVEVEEDDEDDEDSVEYDEDELRAMTLRDLRTIAKNLDIDTTGKSKDNLIEAIIETAEA